MQRTPKRITIYSLAKELGVSVATVSKALRGSPEISLNLRKKIREHAEKLNFTPRVVSRKVPNICVLIQQYPGHDLDFSPFLSTVMEGVAQYVREEGLEMSLHADDVHSLNRADLVRELHRRSIDGVVVLRSNDQSQYFSQLEAQNFPHCALLSTAPKHLQHTIVANNYEVGRQATNHLIDKGHRRIGVLVSPPGAISGKMRFDGYRQALEERGIAFDKRLIREEPTDLTGLQFGDQGIVELLAKNPDITAVFAMDHMVALGMLHGLQKTGRQVPQSISVISCDDYPESPYLTPPLTVIDIPNRKLGYLAAKQVYRFIRGLEPICIDDQVDLNGNLIVRQSVRDLTVSE